MVVLARPGAGKSTQAHRLAQLLGVVHVSAGPLLRREVAAASDLGRAIASTLEQGELVADEVVLTVVQPHLIRAVAAGGYILDDVPRSLPQARGLAAMSAQGLAPQMALSLEVSAQECRRRLLERAATQGRDDDRAETIARRLAVYDEQMAPVRSFYQDAGMLATVDGSGSPDQVTDRLLALVRQR